MNKILKYIKNHYLLFIFILCLLITIILIAKLLGNEIIKIDVISYNIFVKLIRNSSLTKIMKFITFFGSARFLIIFSIISIIFLKNKRKGICISINLTVIFLANILLKNIIQRIRPEGYSLIVENSYSFPSGHSMTSMAFYGFLIYLSYKYIKNNIIKRIFIIFLSLLILLIGISRVYLGVHYASDVIGGFLISISYLIVFIKVTNKFISKNETI